MTGCVDPSDEVTKESKEVRLQVTALTENN
jgi:hypothetical protein